MKLGVTYSCFEGISELLEKSIMSIRTQVDVVQCMWQEYSWIDDRITEEDYNTLQRLKSIGLIDDLLLYNVRELSNKNSSEEKQLYERHKRLIGLDRLQKAGCNYGFIMDSDEFFRSEEFAKAKQFIEDNDIERSYVEYTAMLNKPIYREKNPNKIWDSFITRIDIPQDNTQFRTPTNPRVDFTKAFHIDTVKDFVFSPEDILKYHMWGIRKNLYKKFMNSSCTFPLERIRLQIQSIRNISDANLKFVAHEFHNAKSTTNIIEKIPNYFNIPNFEPMDMPITINQQTQNPNRVQPAPIQNRPGKKPNSVLPNYVPLNPIPRSNKDREDYLRGVRKRGFKGF